MTNLTTAQVEQLRALTFLGGTFRLIGLSWDAESGELRIHSGHGLDEYVDTVDRFGNWHHAPGIEL